MARRSFSWEFKLEAVRLVEDWSVSFAQAARDLDSHDNVLRRWVRQYRDDPAHAFPGGVTSRSPSADDVAVVGYYVYRSDRGNSNQVQIGTTASTVFQDLKAQSGEQYF